MVKEAAKSDGQMRGRTRGYSRGRDLNRASEPAEIINRCHWANFRRIFATTSAHFSPRKYLATSSSRTPLAFCSRDISEIL